MQHLQLEDNAKTRTMIQRDLYDLNPLSSIMTRTRKVEVTEDYSQAVRDTIAIPVKLYEGEQLIFNKQRAEWDELEESGKMEPIARSTRERQLASSVYAFVGDRNTCWTDFPDAKYDKLLEILKANGKKVIVFVEFKDTLYYLSKRFSDDGINYRFISGDDNTHEERIKSVEEFKNQPEIQVLISTQVGGEGLDMQFCDTLVNYDLPWNPMIVEQRIGRIDRIGQQSEVIHIFSLLVEGSIQAKIHDRLLGRIEIFRNTIGDLEPILSGRYGDGTIEEAIENLYRTKLTEAELDDKLLKIERAIERNLSDAKQIEKELSNSFTSDSYLREHLNSIIRKRAYVTEQEVENYVRTLFRKHLPTCSISQAVDGICKINVPQSDPKALLNFLNRYSLMGGDSGIVTTNFINSVRGKSELQVTFIQQVAEDNRSVTYLNIYHPLVLIAKEVYKQDMGKQNDNIFRFCIERQMLGKTVCKIGYYVLANYNISTEYNRYGKQRKVQELFSALYDLQEHDILDDENAVDAVFCAAQGDGILWHGNDAYRVVREDIEDMRICMSRIVREHCESHRSKVIMQQRDDIAQQRHGIQYRYEKQINDLKSIMENTLDRISYCDIYISRGMGEDICWWDEYDIDRSKEKKRTYLKAKEELQKVIPAMQGRQQSLEAEYAASMQRLEAIPDPIVSSKLMTLNLIHII